MSFSQNIDFPHLQTLAADAQKGNKEAYRQFLASLVPYIRAIVRYRVGAVADVDDIVQNVLLGIHVSLHTFRTSARIKPWVDAIIHYKVTDFFRAVSRKKEFAAGDNIDVTFPAPEPNAVTERSVKEEKDAWALVESLPAGMKEAVMLTKREGLSTRDAAKRLGIAEATLRKRVSRAYSKLASLYEKTYRKENE